jgi:arsenate reductase-like glutaredoxin family protein
MMPTWTWVVIGVSIAGFLLWRLCKFIAQCDRDIERMIDEEAQRNKTHIEKDDIEIEKVISHPSRVKKSPVVRRNGKQKKIANNKQLND